jgi:alanine dehydrogenase
VAGAKAPVLVSSEMVSHMKPGAVIVDVSIDQGGCIETIRPTTHRKPVYTRYGVVHYAVPNIPAAVPRTSTYALTNATLPYIRTIASKGISKAATDDPALARGINCANGFVVHAAVGEAFGMKIKPWQEAL